MENLKYEELIEGDVIEYNGERLLILEKPDEYITYIDEFESNPNFSKNDLNDKVNCRARFKVKVLAEDKFSKDFITHRYINSYLCLYRDIKDYEYTTYSHDESSEKIIDNFNNVF